MANISAAAQKEIDGMAKLFQVTDNDLLQITKAFGGAFHHGLQVPDQSIIMVPSFVTEEPSRGEKGAFLTLDISWTSVAVSKIELDGKRSFASVYKDFEIPKGMLTDKGSAFFDFLASSVKIFLLENSIQGNSFPLAFIFEFSVQKRSLVEGTLLGWSKGYRIKGVVGQDPAALLQKALDKTGAGIKVVALINDTVSVFLSEAYLSAPCVMSAIYGAGTNGAYMEPASGIKKVPQFKGEKMVINTEWGAFNDHTKLKPNVYDDLVMQADANPSSFLFQKMSCWFHLGEIICVVLLPPVEKSHLFSGVTTDTLNKYHGLTTYHSFLVEDAKDLATVKNIISEALGYRKKAISDKDAEIIRRVCSIVATRSGKLAGCPMAALLVHQGYATLGQNNGASEGKLPIAINGQFFVGSAQFTARLKQSLSLILGGDFVNRLEFIMVKEAGVIGGAIAAYQGSN